MIYERLNKGWEIKASGAWEETLLYLLKNSTAIQNYTYQKTNYNSIIVDCADSEQLNFLLAEFLTEITNHLNL